MKVLTVAFTTVIGFSAGCVIGDEPIGENEPEIIGGVTDSGDPAVRNECKRLGPPYPPATPAPWPDR